MRMKNRTSEHVAIVKEKSRYWESKNNLNVWMRTIQGKSKKKNNKEIKMRELKKRWSKKKRKGGKYGSDLCNFRNLKLLFTRVISHPHPNVTFSSAVLTDLFIYLFFLWAH